MKVLVAPLVHTHVGSMLELVYECIELMHISLSGATAVGVSSNHTQAPYFLLPHTDIISHTCLQQALSTSSEG